MNHNPSNNLMHTSANGAPLLSSSGGANSGALTGAILLCNTLCVVLPFTLVGWRCSGRRCRGVTGRAAGLERGVISDRAVCCELTRLCSLMICSVTSPPAPHCARSMSLSSMFSLSRLFARRLAIVSTWSFRVSYRNWCNKNRLAHYMACGGGGGFTCHSLSHHAAGADSAGCETKNACISASVRQVTRCKR